MSHPITAVSQMLTRNQSLFVGKRLLICGALEDSYPSTLLPLTASLTLFTTNYSYYCQHQATLGDSIEFNHQLTGSPRFDALLLLMPKAKAEAEYLLAMVAPLLKQGSDIFIAGENRGGVNSANNLLSAYATQVSKRDSARRCSLYHGVLDKPVAPFEIEPWFNRYECSAGDTALSVLALPGVFSANELDVATQLLLATLPAMTGNLLDFGCGAGIIGAMLAKRNPNLTVTMIDINALALESSRRTLALNQLDGVVYASDIYSNVSDTFDHVVSNPPFHAGLHTHYTATETFLAKTPAFLRKNGTLTIVANAFLRYQPILEQHFKTTEIINSDTKFKIYQSKI